ncbi:MAG: DUF305 domain-containing protein [Candidatus Nomurabacteria bacterium]
MKIIPFIKNFEKKHFNETLIIGVISGIGLGMFLFSTIVPDPSRITRAYPMKAYQEFNSGRGEIITVRRGSGDSMMIQSSNLSPTMMRVDSADGVTYSARAVPATILDEKQFLNEIISQYESNIRLAHQALAVEGISTEVASLAQNIIDTKTAEVSAMKDLLTPKTTTVTGKTTTKTTKK